MVQVILEWKNIIIIMKKYRELDKRYLNKL